MEKVKEPFFTTKPNGTGLGIPLSMEIIKGHEGKTTIESVINEYTKVTISMPVTKI